MKSKGKSILFLSGIDFKEKSIQVIRKTPEAYAKKGWNVDYFVLRDYSKKGNYFYEQPFNPELVNVFRSSYPLRWLRDLIPSGLFNIIINKIILLLGSYKLYRQVKKHLQKKQYDVIYGYENVGVLALHFLKKRGYLNDLPTVSRFQGTWMTSYFKAGRKFKLFLNKDFKMGLQFQSDLAIMTDDGTQGDFIFQHYNPNHPNFKFWCNGVDPIVENPTISAQLIDQYDLKNQSIFLSISRLEGWKRVDRVIHTLDAFKKSNPTYPFKYLVVGDGQERKSLEELVKKLGLQENVIFLGAIPHQQVAQFLIIADIFFSFYSLSNVGNPLLEAIRANKIIFTLNNGDTSKWITHQENGFIYDEQTPFYATAAGDLASLLSNEELYQQIKQGITETCDQKLWTWEERFNAEVNEVEKLC